MFQQCQIRGATCSDREKLGTVDRKLHLIPYDKIRKSDKIRICRGKSVNPTGIQLESDMTYMSTMRLKNGQDPAPRPPRGGDVQWSFRPFFKNAEKGRDRKENPWGSLTTFNHH